MRIHPTKTRAGALAVRFGCPRWVLNEALALSQKTYREVGKGLTYHALATRLPALKQKHKWLRNADSQVLQASLQNLAAAFETAQAGVQAEGAAGRCWHSCG